MPRCLRIVTNRRRFDADGEDGFSLIEVLVSLGLLVTVMLSTAGFFSASLKQSNGQTQAQQAAVLANQQLEYTRSVAAQSLLKGRTSAQVQLAITNKGITDLSNDVTNANNYDPTATAASSQAVPITMNQTVDGTAYTLTTFIDQCYVVYGTTTTGGCVATQPTPSNGWMYRITVNVAYKLGGGRVCASSGTTCQFVASTLRDPGSDPCFNTRTDLVGCPVSQPTISNFSPNTVKTNTVTTVTLTGTNFASGATVSIDAGGSISNVSVVSSSSITFKLTTANTPAAVGTRTITVTNTNGSIARGTMTITTQDMTLTSITNGPVYVGQTKTLTINGSGFQAGTMVDIAPASGVTILGTPTVAANTITMNVQAAGTAAAVGTYTVTVTNPDGNVRTGTFTVTTAPITFTSVSSPSPFYWGTNTFTVTGTGFVNGATITVDGNAVTAGWVSSTQMTVTMGSTLSVGSHSIRITNPDAGVAAGSFTVNTNPVSVTASPNPASPGTTSFTLTGGTFLNGATVKLDGVALTGTQFARNSTSQISVTLATAPSSGSHTFLVTNPDGGAASDTFDVADLTPHITNVNPDSARRIRSHTFTIYGTNFVPGNNNVTVYLSGDINKTITGQDATGTTATFVYTTPSLRTTYDVNVRIRFGDGSYSDTYAWSLTVTF